MRTSFVAALLALCLTARAPAQSPFVVGEPAPEIVLPTLDGEPMALSSFHGRRVLLEVFASW